VKKITYSTSMTGPWGIEWYRSRGLTHTQLKIVNDPIIAQALGRSPGEPHLFENIITHYAGGHIDVRGLPTQDYTDGMTTYDLPYMHIEDWFKLTEWLVELSTVQLWDLELLLAVFEGEVLNGELIRWYKEQ